MSINFVNPYNFVPLSGDAPKRLDFSTTDNMESGNQELLTGKIEYTIETLTPLFIPNTSNDKAFDVHAQKEDGKSYHHSYDFFSYGDISEDYGKKYHENDYHQPVIPGSEIRGAVRSVFETFTNSCLSSVDTDVKLSKRTPETFKAGVLVREGSLITLYEARDCLYRREEFYNIEGNEKFNIKHYEDLKDEQGNSLKDGQKVCFNLIERYNDKGKKIEKPIAKKLSSIITENRDIGYVMKGVPGPDMGNNKKGEKHNVHIFKKTSNVCISWDMGIDAQKKDYDDVKARLNTIIKLYQNNEGSKTYEKYEEAWEKFKNYTENDATVDAIPVYYSAIDSIYYLSPACITREVYKATMSELLGNHKPCVSSKEICPACALFGTVQSELKVASKIRFSDAYVGEVKDNKDYYLDIVSLQELSAPKLSSTEFYLKRPEVTGVMNWTYDYYVARKNGDDVEVKLYTPTIAGRKFYWHSNKLGDKVINDAKMKPDKKANKVINTERNRTVRPVKSGEIFQGELYFEGITHEQLQQLVAIMNLSSYNTKDDSSARYAMKLGSAKPLGLGSVSLRVNSVKCRELSLGEGNSSSYNEREALDDYNQMLDVVFQGNTNILKILDLDALKPGMVLAYPKKKDDDDKGFKWFGDNKIKYKSNLAGTKLMINDKAGSPSKRVQIEYAQYMQPLQVELGGKADNQVDGRAGERTTNYRPARQNNNNGSNVRKNAASPELNKGDTVDVVVFKVDASGANALVNLKDSNVRGKLFSLPTGIKKGDVVKMKITKVGDDSRLFGNYVN